MAFHASLVKGKAADCHMLLRMIGKIKVPRDRLRYVVVVFLYVTELFLCLFSRFPITKPVREFIREFSF